MGRVVDEAQTRASALKPEILWWCPDQTTWPPHPHV